MGLEADRCLFRARTLANSSCVVLHYFLFSSACPCFILSAHVYERLHTWVPRGFLHTSSSCCFWVGLGMEGKGEPLPLFSIVHRGSSKETFFKLDSSCQHPRWFPVVSVNILWSQELGRSGLFVVLSREIETCFLRVSSQTLQRSSAPPTDDTEHSNATLNIYTYYTYLHKSLLKTVSCSEG